MALVLALAACSKETPATGEAPAASAAKPAAPFTGKLTADRVMGAGKLAMPLQAWDDTFAKLQAELGKPGHEDKGWFTWAVAEGDDCTYYKVERQPDGKVGGVQSPMKVAKDGPIMNRDECLTAAGVRKEALEDPSAAGPPTDGKPVSVAQLLEGAAKAKSKWDKATVTVEGLHVGTNTSESNGVKSFSITLSGAKGDVKSTVHCDLAAPDATRKQWEPITVRGTVAVHEMLSMGGGSKSISADLTKCAVVPAAAGAKTPAKAKPKAK